MLLHVQSALGFLFFHFFLAEKRMNAVFSAVLVEDLERNDGSPERPYSMPRSLMKISEKRNTVQETVSSQPASN